VLLGTNEFCKTEKTRGIKSNITADGCDGSGRNGIRLSEYGGWGRKLGGGVSQAARVWQAGSEKEEETIRKQRLGTGKNHVVWPSGGERPANCGKGSQMRIIKTKDGGALERQRR